MREWSLRPLPSWPLGGPEVRWGVGAAVACLLAAQVFAVVWASAALAALYGSEPLPELADRPIWNLLVLNAGLWLGYLLGPILANRLSESGPLVDFDLRVGPVQAVVAVVAGIGAQLALLPALYWVLLRFVSGDPGATAEALAERVDTSLDALLFVVAVVVVAPVVEEWFYRGMLLSAMARRFGPLAGAIGSSVVFALVHREAILLPGLFLFALVLAWLTMTTGRIGPAIIAHMAFNATTVVQLLA